MFWGLVGRTVRMRYKGSILGVFWTLLSPLMQMGVYSLIFSTIMRIDVPHYPLFVFCSLLPWTWFANSVTMASETIVHNAGLIKKIYFPSELLPLVTVMANLINFLLALPVLFVFLAFAHIPFTWAILALPVVLAIQFLFISALSLFVAMLNTFFRDVNYLLSILMMLWFYVTPVVYPIHMIPAWLMPLYSFNPMTHLVQAYRTIMLEGAMPSWRGLLAAFVLSLVMFGIVYPIFNRQKFKFAEVV